MRGLIIIERWRENIALLGHGWLFIGNAFYRLVSNVNFQVRPHMVLGCFSTVIVEDQAIKLRNFLEGAVITMTVAS